MEPANYPTMSLAISLPGAPIKFPAMIEVVKNGRDGTVVVEDPTVAVVSRSIARFRPACCW